MVPLGPRPIPRIAGTVALVLGVTLPAGVPAAAAAAPSRFVVGSRLGFPEWVSGPLHELEAPGLSPTGFWVALLAAFLVYLVVLEAARRQALPVKWVVAAIALAHVAVLLGPLTSTDPFGYLGYARLAAVHGLDPYTHGEGSLVGDPVSRWLLWHEDPSPYGPLWTLISMGVVPLGIAGGAWAFKTIAVLSSLALIGLVARAARLLGRDPVYAVAFLGLHPLMLLYPLGRRHHDALAVCGSVGTLVLLRERRDAWAGAAAAAPVAIKAVAAPPLLLFAPFVRRPGRLALGAVVTAVLIVAAAWLAIGAGILKSPSATLAQQDKASAYSIMRVFGDFAGIDVRTLGDVVAV